MKKSGILLALLLLATFALSFSSSASAQTLQAPPAAQAVQPAAPLPSFLTAPAVQTPAVAPANGAGEVEWLATKGGVGVGKPVCRCSTNAQCGTGGACCWWPKQTCGICC